MIVVSNASPLINLAWIEEFELLEQLFGKIIIPNSVWNEVVLNGKGQPGSEEVKSAGWIQKKEIVNNLLVQSFLQELDRGEAETIALAIEQNADLVLIDEKIGRETALYFGLKPLGVIGILIQAKRTNRIKEIRLYLDLLRDRAGFYIKENLYNQIISEQE
jgi:uncharacterized protein